MIVKVLKSTVSFALYAALTMSSICCNNQNRGILLSNEDSLGIMMNASLSSYLMVDELPDSSVYKIRLAIATADTLTDVFFFQNGGWEDSINPRAFRLMERAIQRSFNYQGPFVYAHEWACHDTVSRYFCDYLREKSINVDKIDSLLFQDVMNDIDFILDHYDVGSQADMNTVAFVNMNMNCYKTIGTYKDVMDACNDNNLKKAYFMDYADWIDLFSAINERHQGNYSMYPMEINSYGAEMMKFRYNMLQEEIKMLKNGKVIPWDLPKHPINWEKTEDAELLRPWYNRRMQNADKLKDEKLSGVFKQMTDKIAYHFLDNMQFESW